MSRLPAEKTIARRRNRIASVADRLTDDVLADLRRRAGEPQRRDPDGIWQPAPNEDGAGIGHHDGYGTGTSNGPTPRGEHGDPTARRVAQDAGGRDEQPDTWPIPPDPIGQSIADLFDKLTDMANLAVDIDKLADYILNAERAARGRQSHLDGVCLVCDTAVTGIGNDRLRAGYCVACYSAWRRSEHYDRGDHLRYRRQRRKELRTRDEDAA